MAAQRSAATTSIDAASHIAVTIAVRSRATEVALRIAIEHGAMIAGGAKIEAATNSAGMASVAIATT